MAPINDNFANAIQLIGTVVSVTGINLYATGEAGEPDHADPLDTLDASLYRNSVWWTWTAPQDGPVHLDTIGSSINTTLGVYTGSSVNTLTPIIKSDLDGGGSGSEKVTFNAVAGQTYRIAVDGSYAAAGDIKLTLVQESNSVMTLSGTNITMPIDNAELDVGQFMGPGATGGGTAGIKYKGIDFFDYGDPIFNSTISVNGNTYVNGNFWAIAPTITNQSLDTLNQATISGSPIQGLNFERVVSFLDGDNIIVIQDTFTNVGSTTLENLATLESADPDQSHPLGGGTQATYNDVHTGGLVTATANIGSGYTVGFGSADAAARASVGSATDPHTVLTSPNDPNYTLVDTNISLGISYGSLAAGQSMTKTWYIVFGDTLDGAKLTYNSTVTTTEPIVSSLTVSTPTIGDATVTGGVPFTITVVYDKAMNTTVAPTISFPISGENPSNTLQFSSGQWVNDTTYVATYALTDANETIPNIDVQVSGARSTGSIAQLIADYANIFSIDTVAPATPSAPDLATSSDLGALSDDNLTSDNTPTFIGTGEAGSTVELWSGTTKLGSAIATTGTWTITVPVEAALTTGSYTITVKAIDSAGNISQPSQGLALKIDTVAPTVTVNSLSTSDTTPLLTGSIDDPTATVQVTVGGQTYAATNNGNGTWTLVDNTISPALVDGTYSVTVTATDAAGNVGSQTKASALTVDTALPVVTINKVVTRDTTPALSGTVDDAQATIHVTVNNQTYTATNQQNGSWVLADGSITSALVNGIYDVTVTATNAKGNVGTDSTTNELTIDTIAPIISINTIGTWDITPALSGTVNDSTANIIISLNGGTYFATNHGNGTWSLVDNTLPALSNGTYDVIAKAIDAAGNLGTDTTVNELTVDTVPLYVDIVEVFPDPRTYSTSAIAINFNKAVTGFDLADLSLTYNGTPISLATASLTTSNGAAWTLGNLNGLTTSPGSYNLVLKSGSGIVDGAGHSLMANVTDTWQVEGAMATPPGPISFPDSQTGVTRVGNSAANTLAGKSTNDTLVGVGGNDTLYNRGGHDLAYGGGGRDRIYGQAGSDRLYGGGGGDFLDGGGRRDLLDGGGGKDKLLGGKGNDILVGGMGNDILKGGSGKDVFQYNSVAEGGDRIGGFNPYEDVIDLRPIFAHPEYAGSSSYSRFEQFVQLVQGSTGTEVRIDKDGNGTGTTFVTLATLTNIQSSWVSSSSFAIV